MEYMDRGETKSDHFKDFRFYLIKFVSNSWRKTQNNSESFNKSKNTAPNSILPVEAVNACDLAVR